MFLDGYFVLYSGTELFHSRYLWCWVKLRRSQQGLSDADCFYVHCCFFFFEQCYQSALFETSHYLLKNSKSCFIIVVVLAHCVHPSGLLFSFSYRIWCPRLCASEHVSKGETFHYIHMPNKPYKMHSPCLKLCAHLWLHINLILYWYTSLHTVGPKSVRPLF